MKAAVITRISQLPENREPLHFIQVPDPIPQDNEILLRVTRCGVCHTELDEIEGRTPHPCLPVVPGHQVVGTVAELGPTAEHFRIGDRVGVAWIFSACGKCQYCLNGDENLCELFVATGRDKNGGYAQYMTVPETFSFPIPQEISDSEAAPLLCAGAIGYRSLRMAQLLNGQAFGLTGFGASAHLVLKLAQYQFPESPIFVFSRSPSEREFALELGAAWTGDASEKAPLKLKAIIDTTPAWKPVVEALSNLEPGGRLVINAIRKENADRDYFQRLDYPTHLWMEKEIKSVANVTRRDIREFLNLAARIPIRAEYQEYRLEEANQALVELKERKIRGAKVLRID